MFARIKKTGKYQYLQLVKTRREGKKVIQQVIGTIGRIDKLQEKGEIDALVRSLARFSEKALMILSGKSDPSVQTKKIGPSLIFERLWEELKIKQVIKENLNGRKFEIDIERAVFLTVLHRLMVSGSDRSCDRWRRDYIIKNTESISLNQVYRAMAFLGDPIEDQTNRTLFSPRCTKDLIEEDLYFTRRDLLTELELVFFDTTSIYFEGSGGDELGQLGHSKDYRPDLKQMVIGVVIDDSGRPLCCEIWPGNTTDVKSLIPIVDRIRKRFKIGQFCIVADRGMISAGTMKQLEEPERDLKYILGARMRKVNEIKHEVLSRAGRFKEVVAEGSGTKDPDPLKVKEVMVDSNRYIVCLNPRQARKDQADREAIVESLEKRIKSGPKSMIGNKGYRKYLKVSKNSVSIDKEKIEAEARFDGKWVLKTNTDLPTEKVALKYKELWQVEHLFRDMKSILETRPIYHKKDETIRGHVFCSFLALMLRKELDRRLEEPGFHFEWNDIKMDLKSLQETVIEENGKQMAVRSECVGTCGKVFQAVGVAIPPTIREL
jgi:transposase